jgi:GGDEF domain-containing protein
VARQAASTRVPADDLVARLGGDEFAVLMEAAARSATQGRATGASASWPR